MLPSGKLALERDRLLIHADSVWSKESLDVRKLAAHVDRLMVGEG